MTHARPTNADALHSLTPNAIASRTNMLRDRTFRMSSAPLARPIPSRIPFSSHMKRYAPYLTRFPPLLVSRLEGSFSFRIVSVSYRIVSYRWHTEVISMFEPSRSCPLNRAPPPSSTNDPVLMHAQDTLAPRPFLPTRGSHRHYNDTRRW
ncbi:hypothetical protein HYPSUDRAFT_208411 [Hypholoma sublateritium FD-334 SS-4]|uniref:Uncharacterized protein n=1 Tax=Hypholoma sublateritium (strain FD-334 SS-4) TaxID=945553 RepID=A0A0D2LVC6_HYPSF|nr:hypothetical protein HYPSUDRAFT_208411 [Hypholoma sublateritium FD-334 SS-4]